MTVFHIPYKEPGTCNNTDKAKNKLVHVVYIVFEFMLLERLLLLTST